MATKFYHRTSSASEPMPNAHIDTTYAFDLGTFTGPRDATPDLGNAANRIDTLQTANSDSNFHYVRLTSFVTPPLAAQTLTTPTIKANLWAFVVSGIGTPAWVKLIGSVFKWSAADSSNGQIGTSVLSSALTSSSALYSLTLHTGSNVTIAEGDRLVAEVYYELKRDTTSSSGSVTIRYRYNGSAGSEDSNLESSVDIELLAGTPLYYQTFTP